MMWKWQIVAVSVLPVAPVGAQPCVPGPMPSAETSVGWAFGNWPWGEAIRFAAVPPRGGRAYVVQIDRILPRRGANVQLVALVGEHGCNRWVREQEWRFPLSAQAASLFFDRIAAIEAHWQPTGDTGEIIVGGTGFDYEHRADGVVQQLQLSAMATGQSGRLSSLINSLMEIARGQIPKSPGWDD